MTAMRRIFLKDGAQEKEEINRNGLSSFFIDYIDSLYRIDHRPIRLASIGGTRNCRAKFSGRWNFAIQQRGDLPDLRHQRVELIGEKRLHAIR